MVNLLTDQSHHISQPSRHEPIDLDLVWIPQLQYGQCLSQKALKQGHQGMHTLRSHRAFLLLYVSLHGVKEVSQESEQLGVMLLPQLDHMRQPRLLRLLVLAVIRKRNIGGSV